MSVPATPSRCPLDAGHTDANAGGQTVQGVGNPRTPTIKPPDSGTTTTRSHRSAPAP